MLYRLLCVLSVMTLTVQSAAAQARRPASAPAPMRWQSVVAGSEYSCALDATARAFCWGDNQHGQLGLGRALPRNVPSPTPVRTDSTFTALTGTSTDAGVAATCGTTASRALLCWGYIIGLTERATMAPVGPTSSVVFAQVSFGGSVSCGLTAAGGAWCWGSDEGGQLGDSSRRDSDTPVAVVGRLVFQSIAAGGDHTCGLTDSLVAYCWGANALGQLGSSEYDRAPEPVAVAGVPRFAAISAGGTHSCGLTPDGVIYCWGSNDHGELGAASSGICRTDEGDGINGPRWVRHRCSERPVRVRAPARAR